MRHLDALLATVADTGDDLVLAPGSRGVRVPPRMGTTV